MKAKRKVLIMAVVALVCLTALAALTVWACRETYTIKTAADATAGDVTFLKLPPSASHIGYWRDGLNYWAEFQIPEQDFRQVFLLYRFQEITDVLEVRPKRFGDPQTFPPHAPATPVQVSSGLLYQERWSNGGGYRIVYDRASSRAYYSSSKR